MERLGVVCRIAEKYTPFLKEALNEIDPSYYQVTTTYGDVVRERVFCYELYHQMRLVQDKFNLRTLHPEIDKSGHTIFEKGDKKNPDFIFHKPGEMMGNEVIIEVKGRINEGMFKDFNTLSSFCQKYNYKVGYFILFGKSLSNLQSQLNKKENLDVIMKYRTASNIIVICKKDKWTKIEMCRLSDLVPAAISFLDEV